MVEIFQFFNVSDLDGALERVGEIGNGVIDGGLPAFGGGRGDYGICLYIGVGRKRVQVADMWWRSCADGASRL